MEYIVEDFIEAANKLPDRETLFDYYIQTLGQFGFDTAIYTFACLLYTSPSPRDQRGSRMPSSA